jgi:hypothetical protein
MDWSRKGQPTLFDVRVLARLFVCPVLMLVPACSILLLSRRI